jgi:hypothetical protein
MNAPAVEMTKGSHCKLGKYLGSGESASKVRLYAELFMFERRVQSQWKYISTLEFAIVRMILDGRWRWFPVHLCCIAVALSRFPHRSYNWRR